MDYNKIKESKVCRFFKQIYPYLCILGMAIIILYPQIRARIYLAGLDSWFHMNQVYDTAMQFKTGHFSYFILLFGFDRIGRIVNAIYGPGFVYLNGLILLLAKTWYKFEIIQDILGLLLGGGFFYLLAHKNNVTNFTATLLSILYMLSEPVLTWVINQEFNGLEAILIPLILLQGTQMVRSKKIYPLTLSLIMAVVFQTHMLTTLIGTIVLIPFFVLTWCKTDQKILLWKDLLKSIILTALLTANVWGAALNVFSQKLIPPVPQGMPRSGGAVTWMLPGHYFSVLGFMYSIIMAFLVGCCLISLLFWRRSTVLYKIIALGGLLTCWLSSIYFPWRWLLNIYPDFVYQIQFPKRFLCVGMSLLFLSSGMLFSGKDVQIINPRSNGTHQSVRLIIQMILIGFVIGGYVYQKSLFKYSFNQYNSNQVIGYSPFFTYHPNQKLAYELRTAYHSPRLSNGIDLIHQDTSDYLPARNVIHTYQQYRDNAPYSGIQGQVYNNLCHLHARRLVNHNQLTLLWNQKQAKRNMILPIAKYQGTKVMLNQHRLRNPQISRIGMVKVPFVHKGRNAVSISYQVPLWLKSLMWITGISWLWMLLYFIYWFGLKVKRRFGI